MKKLIWINIMKKRKRTFLSILSVALSGAIIFSSLSLMVCILSYAKTLHQDHYHYAFYSEKEVSLPESRYTWVKDVEGELSGFKMRSLSNYEESGLPLRLLKGRFPQNSGEIMIGETLSLEIGAMVESFEVVGIYEYLEEVTNLYADSNVVYGLFEVDGSGYYYVIDRQVHLRDSLESLLKYTGLEEKDIYVQLDAIGEASIAIYLKNQKVMVLMMTVIILLAICISVISIRNVMVTCDRERRKEIGLMKSVGARPVVIFQMIFGELLILGIVGALLGEGVGLGLSYWILGKVASFLRFEVTLAFLLNPYVMVITFLLSFSIMVFAGYQNYRGMLRTMPMVDLKEEMFDGGKVSEFKSHDFQWHMFLVYNGRMKHQTRNLFQSFLLLLVCTSLFSSVFLSLKIFQMEYKEEVYDFEIHNLVNTHNFIEPQVMYQLYELEDRGELMLNNLLSSHRLLFSLGQMDTFGHETTVFDDEQLREMKSRCLIDGSLDQLTANDVVVVAHESLDPMNPTFRDMYQVGEGYRIAAVVEMDDFNAHWVHLDLDQSLLWFGVSLEAFGAERGFAGTEHIYLRLQNPSEVMQVKTKLENMLVELNLEGLYEIEFLSQMLSDNEVTTFLLESLLYPLLFMLFLASLINITQVLESNLYLKRKDVSIMKSVGMKNRQLRQLFLMEYLEGYLNAALVASVIVLFGSWMISIFKIAEVFDFGAHMMGAQLISVAVIAVLLLTPNVMKSLVDLSKITPTEALKDQF